LSRQFFVDFSDETARFSYQSPANSKWHISDGPNSNCTGKMIDIGRKSVTPARCLQPSNFPREVGLPKPVPISPCRESVIRGFFPCASSELIHSLRCKKILLSRSPAFCELVLNFALF
jgi:hypothetical protein